ncbi:MAG TPA: TIM barrel protein [Candidatus Caccousia avistercoris]|nr:TIM barrel protein [Candidatus Caccousia avistercoris]
MKDSIHKYFQIGTVLWMSFPGEDSLTALRRIGGDSFFDGVEVCSFPEGKREEAARVLEESGLRAWFGAQPALLGGGLNPNALQEEDRLAAERALLQAVDEAAALGARGVAFLSGHWQEETREEALAQLVKTTEAVCRYGETKGLSVELEVFDYDMDKRALIGPAPLAARFAREMRARCGNFGLLADLSHFPTTYEDSRFVVHTLRPWLTHFHIGNAVVEPGRPAYGDQHPRFGFPHSANGVPQLTEFLRALREEGFFRPEDPYPLSFEVKPWQGEDAALVLAGAKRALNRAWALLED